MAISRLRPIHHQLDPQFDRRIEAHSFVAFIAYCLHVTLKQRLRALAPRPPPRITADAAKSV